MSKDKPVTIGRRTFQSQKTARAFFHAMLDRYEPGARVTDADAADLLALVGGAALSFDVITTELGPRSFRVTRPGGEPSPFHIGDCVKERRPSSLVEISAALRETVKDDLARARERHLARHVDDDGYVECAITRNRIMPSDGEIEHLPPHTFEALVTAFLHGSIPQLPLDVEVGRAFRAYHAKTARLGFVQRHVKLSGRKART